MFKTIPLSLVLVCSILVAFAFKNWPPELTTRGPLSEPVEICPDCHEPEDGWEFKNESDCDVTIELAVTFNYLDQNQQAITQTYGLEKFNVASNSTHTLTFLNIYNQLSALTSSSGPFTITHVGAELGIAGYYGYGYPDGSVQFTNPNLNDDDPCKCLIWIPDFVNKKIILKKC